MMCADHRYEQGSGAAPDGTNKGGIADPALLGGGLRGTLRNVDRTAVYALDGEIDRTNAEALHDRLIDIAGVGEGDHLVLDMSAVTVIDGPAIGRLIQVSRALAAKGSRFELVNVPDEPLRMLRQMGLTDYFGLDA